MSIIEFWGSGFQIEVGFINMKPVVGMVGDSTLQTSGSSKSSVMEKNLAVPL